MKSGGAQRKLACFLKEKDGNQKAWGCFSLPGVQAFKGLLLLLLYLLDAHFICVYIVTFNTMVI